MKNPIAIVLTGITDQITAHNNTKVIGAAYHKQVETVEVTLSNGHVSLLTGEDLEKAADHFDENSFDHCQFADGDDFIFSPDQFFETMPVNELIDLVTEYRKLN